MIYQDSKLWCSVCILIIIVFAVFVIKGYMKRLSRGFCGSGNTEKYKKLRVKDKNKSHYSYTVILTVEGMVCGACAKKIENALNALEGIWATADVNTKQVLVRMKCHIREQLLRDTVNNIGAYTVMSISGTLNNL